jgi:SH3-like domain-containing protein
LDLSSVSWHGGGSGDEAQEARAAKEQIAITGRVMNRMSFNAFLAVFLLISTTAGSEVIRTGQVTNLPLPRFVSMKAAEGNVRRGPSLTHRIDWVFKRRDMPLQITAEYGHWRRVQDRDGQGGWVHYSLLSGARTVIVEDKMVELYQRPDAKSPVVAALEIGVIARLGKCGPDYCELKSGGYKGWATKQHLWGIAGNEVRD